MKKTVTILFLLAIACIMQAQVPVKRELMQLYGKYPPPPANSKDAFTKLVATEQYGVSKCSAEKMFAPIDKEIKSIEAEFAAQPKPDASSMSAGVLSTDNMKKMSDPDMRKKMKSKGKEEKMKMAMEMMKSMPKSGPALEPDPPAVRAALDEWQKIYNDTQNEFKRSVAEQEEGIKSAEEYKKAHADIDAWEAAEVAKLPQISSGEMSAPDPAKVKVVRLKSADKHITIADKRVEQLRGKLSASADHAKTRYSAFYQKLIAANYAADSKNFSTKKILADAQLMILKDLASQIELSRKAWEESASWQMNREKIEKEKN